MSDNEQALRLLADTAALDPEHRAVLTRAADEIAVLRDALALARAHPDFDHGGVIPEVLDAALAGKRHESLVILERLAALQAAESAQPTNSAPTLEGAP